MLFIPFDSKVAFNIYFGCRYSTLRKITRGVLLDVKETADRTAEIKQLTVRLSGELIRKVKIHTAKTGQTLRVVVHEALQHYLKTKKVRE